MSELIIYINDELVDLDGAVIPITFKLFDVSDIRTRFANHTPEVKLKRSSQNDRVLGFSFKHNSQTEVPYQKLPAKIFQHGIEIMPGAKVSVSFVDGLYNLEFYSGPFGFFAEIQNKLISEIEFGEGLITWDAAFIDSVKNFSGNSALLAPVIQYGQIDEGVATTSIGDVVLPSVRYNHIIEKLIEGAGYIPSGAIFSDDKFENMIVAFSKERFEFSGTFKNNREFIAKKNTVQIVTNPGAGFDVILYDETVLQDGYGFYDASTGRYETDGVSDDREFRCSFYVEVTFRVLSGTYSFELESDDINLPNIQTDSFTAGTYTIKFGIDIGNDDLPGYDISWSNWYETRCEAIVPGECHILSAKFYNKVIGANEIFTSPQFLIQEILPDIEQTEIMRDFAIRFGIIFHEEGNTLHCTQLKEIIQDKSSALEWTSKRDYSVQENMYFKFRNYAQKSNFTYPGSDSSLTKTALISDGYVLGSQDGFISVPNENLELETRFYESIFNGTLTTRMFNTAPASIYCARILVWNTIPVDFETPFDNEPGLRILLVRGKYSGEPNVFYDGNSRSTYLVGYFVDPITDSLAWQAFIDTYYSEVANAFKKVKAPKRNYILNEVDINTLDRQPRLIFDTDSYYLINTVDKYTGGSTTVELFKV